jgi:predicted RNA binding protein YcfA (HicA-like mRNA interferase family)
MPVSRRELVRYLEERNYRLVREGGDHSIYGRDKVRIPVKRHQTLDRITANEICKQAGVEPKF